MKKQARRRLIVNADDFNLTPGVNRAILDAHDHGIVSSTTVLINIPLAGAAVKALKERPHLGAGLHLNVTLGLPVSEQEEVPTLVTAEGVFKKRQQVLDHPPAFRELKAEYEKQIRLFRTRLGRLPTHLDTHHQLHDLPVFFTAVKELAIQYKLPVRRCEQIHSCESEIRTTDSLIGNLDPANYWQKEDLLDRLSALPPGLSEIMCHPGVLDRDLEAVSSFTKGREEEWKVFRDPELRERLKNLQIDLVHFGMCYT